MRDDDHHIDGLSLVPFKVQQHDTVKTALVTWVIRVRIKRDVINLDACLGFSTIDQSDCPHPLEKDMINIIHGTDTN